MIAVTALQVLVGRARRASNVEIMKRRDARKCRWSEKLSRWCCSWLLCCQRRQPEKW